MSTRNTQILSIRDQQLGDIEKNSLPEELFQNITLRPILKLQNELLLTIFSNYALKQKNDFTKFSVNQKNDFIELSLKNDQKLKEFFIGIIVGLFTVEEFSEYSKNKSNFNKRIVSMLIERLRSQLQLI